MVIGALAFLLLDHAVADLIVWKFASGIKNVDFGFILTPMCVNYRYLIELLNCMEKDEVSPNSLILQRLESMASFGDNPKKVKTPTSNVLGDFDTDLVAGVWVFSGLALNTSLE